MTHDTLERRTWMESLARADEADLEEWFARFAPPAYTWLRPPETGLVMVRARAGGTGERFNLGEMTVTRCALRVGESSTGIAYVAGRAARHAELAALGDALMQDARTRVRFEGGLLAALEEKRSRRDRERMRRAAATRVEFFTLARGDGP